MRLKSIEHSHASLKEYWTFRNSSSKKFTHGLHLYPARMHPEIAKNIIIDYAQDKRTLVIDPFVGSGGVLIEGMLHGNNSVGFDINPFAVLLSKVKTTIINPNNAWAECIRIIDNSRRDYHEDKFYPGLVPTGYNVEFWHKPSVIKKLSILKHHIYNSNSNSKIIDFLKICLSLTVRNTSNERKGEFKNWRMNKDELIKFRPNVFTTFSEICQRNCSLASDFRSTMRGNKAKAIIRYGNALTFSENFKKLDLDDSHGQLVMTSPPYGDHRTTVAYGEFSTHIGLWLDLKESQLKQVDRVCLGGKRDFEREDKDFRSPHLSSNIRDVLKNDPNRALDVYSFFHDLDHCLAELSKVLRSGKSHVCIVVANRTVRRIPIHTDKILVELSKKYGFRHIVTYPRNIPIKLMSARNAPENKSNQSGQTMTEESIVVMKY